MTLALKPANARTWHPESGPAPAYSEDELAAARRAFRLPPGADAGPWVDHGRALAHWRYRVAEWLVVFLASPAEYVRRTVANRERLRPESATPDWRRAWEAACHAARQQVLDLAADGQRPLDLAWEILSQGNRDVLRELVHAGWLPRTPASPYTATVRRTGISDEQRMRDAEEIAAGFGP